MTKKAAPPADEITWVELAEITKRSKNADGSITVVGVVSDPKVDADKQIMDPAFLKAELPKWFGGYANVREMHQPSAVGVGKVLDTDVDGRYVLTSKIVDPLAVLKCDEGVYNAYSVGVKGARIVRDPVAQYGRIVGGRIIEVSLVDHPASDVGKFTIAKAAGADNTVALGEGVETATEADIEKAVAVDPEPEPTADPAATVEADAAKAVSTAGAGESPVAATNLSSAQLRSAVLGVNPSVKADQLEALIKAFELVVTPNQAAGGIETQSTPSTATPELTDPDDEPGPQPAGDVARPSRDNQENTGPAHVGADELAGSLKLLLPDAIKAAFPDFIPAFTESDVLKAALVDAIKVAAVDLVKSAVADGLAPVTARLEKLEKLPAPEGPITGDVKRFALNEDRATSGPLEIAPEAARDFLMKVAILQERKKSTDPEVRKAAAEALSDLEPQIRLALKEGKAA